MTFDGLPGGYGCILADPPWGWLSFSGKASAPHRTEIAPYSVMTAEDMSALPVADLAGKHCALIMWVIGSHLDQALDLGRAWGFAYSTDVFTWVKVGKNDAAVRPIGMGKWSRKQTEQALLFTRGKPSRIEAGVRQLMETDEHVIYAPRREHSRKPHEQYERIERLVAGPYLEMFARDRRPGWDAWGNETDKFAAPAFTSFDDILGGTAVTTPDYADILG